MVNFILPADPDSNQIKKLRLKIMNQMTTIGKLLDISLDLFEELRLNKPDSRLLVEWRWIINDLL